MIRSLSRTPTSWKTPLLSYRSESEPESESDSSTLEDSYRSESEPESESESDSSSLEDSSSSDDSLARLASSSASRLACKRKKCETIRMQVLNVVFDC
jgi:hypothetical protein